nr:cytochrome c peroxidase [uncultured Desulfobacter sp.]
MKKKVISIFISSLFLITAVWAAGGKPNVATNMEKLGMRLYNDRNMSFNGTQSCRNCHHHISGFADITNYLDPETNFVSTGDDGISKGGRNAPSSAYAGYSPVLQQDASGDWFGGMFWDGRAAGWLLGDPLAEQAQGPPLNPVEMGMPDKAAVIQVIKDSDYLNLWIKEFGADSLDDVNAAYDKFGEAIAAYERSADVTKFSSKFDTIEFSNLSEAEQKGKALFETNCSSCHSTEAAFEAPAPLFTNYQYANIGVPANPEIPSEGPDLGLGGVAEINDSAQYGKFKIPTLRNIALTAPYSHNGVFPTLMEMLEFLNDRTGFTPEVSDNLSTEVGSMGLLPEDLTNIEAFLMTLTDN